MKKSKEEVSNKREALARLELAREKMKIEAASLSLKVKIQSILNKNRK